MALMATMGLGAVPRNLVADINHSKHALTDWGRTGSKSTRQPTDS
jgi:hypothetical protein